MKTDELLEFAPYDGSQEAEDLFMQALQEECVFHYEHNEMYQRFCDRKGFDPHKPFQSAQTYAPAQNIPCNPLKI